MFWAAGPGHSQWLHVVRTGVVGHVVVQLVGSNEGGGQLQGPCGQVPEKQTQSGTSNLRRWAGDGSTKVLLPWGAPKLLWNAVETGSNAQNRGQGNTGSRAFILV